MDVILNQIGKLKDVIILPCFLLTCSSFLSAFLPYTSIPMFPYVGSLIKSTKRIFLFWNKTPCKDILSEHNFLLSYFCLGFWDRAPSHCLDLKPLGLQDRATILAFSFLSLKALSMYSVQGAHTVNKPRCHAGSAFPGSMIARACLFSLSLHLPCHWR